MSKKNANITQGIMNTLRSNSNSNFETNTNITQNQTEKNTDSEVKSTRGRKKKTIETTVKFSGKKVVISKKPDIIEKKNKTFYIDTKHLKTLENISKQTGMTTSELIEIAIQLLNNNLELEGFED